MPAIPLIKEDDMREDGSRYEMVAWNIPKSNDFPNGIKYSFQYMTGDGDILLRFDNAPHHLDIGRHHRHTMEGDIEPVDYINIRDLADRFLNEVNEIYEQRTNRR